MKIVCDMKSKLNKINGRSKTLSEPHRVRTRSESTSVLFVLHIDFENITHIHRFYIENQKIH